MNDGHGMVECLLNGLGRAEIGTQLLEKFGGRCSAMKCDVLRAMCLDQEGIGIYIRGVALELDQCAMHGIHVQVIKMWWICVKNVFWSDDHAINGRKLHSFTVGHIFHQSQHRMIKSLMGDVTVNSTCTRIHVILIHHSCSPWPAQQCNMPINSFATHCFLMSYQPLPLKGYRYSQILRAHNLRLSELCKTWKLSKN